MWPSARSRCSELGVRVRLGEGVRGDKALRPLIHACDVVLELRLLDPPLASSTDLDGRQFSIADKGVCLGAGDVQQFGDIGQGQESRLGHARIVAQPTC